MANLEDMVTDAKDRLPNVTPVPPAFHQQATASELKSRLQWGEPALTIVDIRDPDAFMACRIQGAVNVPARNLVDQANSVLFEERDIYLYGNSDDEAASAVTNLRTAGFEKVAQLVGGLDAWISIQGVVEGREADSENSPGAYNVVSRLREFSQEKANEERNR